MKQASTVGKSFEREKMREDEVERRKSERKLMDVILQGQINI